MEPLQYLNISHIYSQYFSIIDFFVFVVLFVGLAQVAFHKRFEGRGGKAVIIAVGVSLALGLSLAEDKFRFNLGSFGGLAVSILILIMGMLIFYLLDSFGLNKTTASVLAFIIAYLLLQSISKNLASWFQQKFPLLNLLFLIACMFMLIKGASLLRLSPNLKSHAKKFINKSSEYLRKIPLREEKQEKQKLRDEVKTIRKERKISSKMLNQLYQAKKLIKEFGDTEKGREAMGKQIEALSANENKLLQKLQHLRDLDKKLENLDVFAINKLKEEYGLYPKKKKARIAREIQTERDKYKLSQKMEALEDQIKKNVDGFNLCICSCVEYLGKAHILEALQSIDKVIEYQMAIDKLFKEMERIGAFMIGLTKREYKAMKREAKEAA